MRAPDCGTQVTAARPERRLNNTAIAAFYEAAVMLAVFLLFGHWIEMKARRGSSDSVRELLDLPRRPHLTESAASAIELQALAGCLRAQSASACRSSASRRRRSV